MRKIFAGCLALAALLAAQTAGAADLSVEPLYKAPPEVVKQPFDWSGVYLGINGGGAWGKSDWVGLSKLNVSGGQVGGTAGYNWQLGNTVFGLEGDLDWSGLKGTSSTGLGTSESWLSTVRGRLGYSFDRFMPYVTGGLAAGNIKASAPGLPGGSRTNAGWTVGGGVEFALPGNWSANAEYLHIDLGSFNCGTACGGTPNQNVSLRDNVFRAGVNYHFGWGK
jgi:outer membrane immunogenic protein